MHGEELIKRLADMGISLKGYNDSGRRWVLINCSNDPLLISAIKKFGGRWDGGWKCWCMERNKPMLLKLLRHVATLRGVDIEDPVIRESRRTLRLKGYSSHTERTYLGSLQQWVDYFYPADPTTITKQQTENWLLDISINRDIKEFTIHSLVNAVKFYKEAVLGRAKESYEITRPVKSSKIPAVFSKEEVKRILNAVDNLKHRTILMACYGSGLRVGEVVKLRVRDIDSDRMVMNVLNAKGKKDRIVPLSLTLLKWLRAYYKKYKPVDYLFEGMSDQMPYSSRSVQSILARAKAKASIEKPGSVHALRHSYATHLLDKGVDVTYIQKLLGHNDLRTTLRYLHVTIRNLHHIESPLEDLDL